MICPILTNAVNSKHHDFVIGEIHCEKERCQWWHKGDENCIVFPIAKSLMDLADVIARSGISPTRPETPQPKEKEPAHDLSIPQSVEPSE